MGNTQKVWIIYAILLSLNFLSAKRYWNKAARLNQTVYFKINLTLKFKSKYMLLWRRGYAFYFHRKYEAVNSFQINVDQI